MDGNRLGNHINKCRFCFATLSKYEDESFKINKSIQNKFFEFTKIKLILSEQYSTQICISCDSRLSDIFEFQKFLINNQTALYQRVDPAKWSEPSTEEIFIKTEPDPEKEVFKRELDDVSCVTFMEPLENIDEFESSSEESELQAVDKICPISGTELTSTSLLKKLSTTHQREFKKCRDEESEALSIPATRTRSIRMTKANRTQLEQLAHENLCSICAKIIRNGRTGLEKHMLRMHSDDFRFFCDLCPQKWKHKWELTKHMKIRHMLEREIYYCSMCPASFKLKYSRKKHILSQHSQDSDPTHECHCGKTFPTRVHMTQHQRIAHESGSFPCQFEGCEKVFKQKGYLSRHMRGFHRKLYKKCEVCEKMMQKCSYKKHLQKHQPPTITCSFEGCTQLFHIKEALKKHILSAHTDERKFVCHICSQASKSKPEMIRHIERVHEAEPISCPVSGCKKSFKQRCNLLRHYKSRCHKDMDKKSLAVLIKGIKDIKGLAW